ncbi:hypothetical protein [Rhizobium sp. G21]|uniref:hypothetical protein n=1 Tax=Rhizobium sp. G21 TaxID=2758439 RepID=UPI0015FF507C|nr:hypothetical protein [Rhizobium sp. G21]MBB1251558.1 hypothetical protein [Rhizobium sp. G21]
MDEILKIRGLRVETVPGGCLVDSVDLDLRRGEVLGLSGESGDGKSSIGPTDMLYASAGCRIVGGSIGSENLRGTAQRGLGKMRDTRTACVAQSAVAAFPARAATRSGEDCVATI